MQVVITIFIISCLFISSYIINNLDISISEIAFLTAIISYSFFLFLLLVINTYKEYNKC
jgi:hypothetical protein